MAEQKRRKPGKGVIFTDLIYVMNPKPKKDVNGRNYQSFYFIIGDNMGFMGCTYYGSVELKPKMALKLLTGRFCPRTTSDGKTFMNLRVDKFEVWEPTKKPENPYDGIIQSPIDVSPKETKPDPELAWIDEEPKKDDSDELMSVKDVDF